jgi:hypothetical protein
MRSALDEMNRKRWLVLGTTSVAAVIFRIAAQLLVPPGDPSKPSVLAPSVIARSGLMPLAFIVYGILTYGSLGIVFIVIQGRLTGTKWAKGLRFGAGFCLVWASYLLEPLPFNTGAKVSEMLSYPLADGSALLVLGVILGWALGTNSASKPESRFISDLLALLVMPALFLAARYYCYTVLHVYSSFDSRPGATLMWTAGVGLCLGVLFLWLRPGIEGQSPLARAAFFTLFVLGIDLLLFNAFMVLAFANFSVLDILVRTVMDLVPVLAGVFILEAALQYRSRRHLSGQSI